MSTITIIMITAMIAIAAHIRFSLALVGGGGGFGLAVGVGVGVPGSRVSGRIRCRVAALGLGGLLRLTNFFITFSHCAWQHVISLSKATKKRSKENAFTALP